MYRLLCGKEYISLVVVIIHQMISKLVENIMTISMQMHTLVQMMQITSSCFISKVRIIFIIQCQNVMKSSSVLYPTSAHREKISILPYFGRRI